MPADQKTFAEPLPEDDAAQRAEVLLDATPDAVVFVDATGTIVRANTEALDTFGYTREELVGSNIDRLVPESMREAHARHRAAYGAAPTGRRAKERRRELTARRRDGSELPVEISLASVPTKTGIVTAAAIRDVTERRRLERETARLAERFVDTIECDDAPFALFDADDRLVLSNAAFRTQVCADFALPVEGRSWVELVGAALDRGLVLDVGHETARARWERYHHAPDGVLDVQTKEGRHWRVVERTTREGGRAITIRDRTDDVRTAAELVSAHARAEAASLAKSEFLSSMSHELRTPLNSVLGFAQLLQRDTRTPLSETQQRSVGRILSGGQHLLRLIDDILDLSRIESGVLLLTCEPVRTRLLLDEVRDAMIPTAQRAGVRVTLGCTVDLGMMADRTRLRQIVLNYVSNAIKYGGAGGTVELSCERRDGSVRVIVRDDGPGVPVADRGRLFDAFFRGAQRAGPIEGTGIGLAICKRLASAMGGSVGFECPREGGAVFWVSLPETAITAPEPAPTGSPSGTFTRPEIGNDVVVYVEDNPSNVELMREVLGALPGLHLRVAGSGAEGLALIRRARPALVLMDLDLPDMSGYDVLRQLATTPETKTIPTFAVSAAAMKNEVERARNAGFARFFPKPLDIEALTRAIEETIHPAS